jgi:hypothetical protein
MEVGYAKEHAFRIQDRELQAAVQAQAVACSDVPRMTAEGLSLKASSGGEVVGYEKGLFPALAN